MGKLSERTRQGVISTGSALLTALLLPIGVLVLVFGVAFAPSWTSTRLIEEDKFAGIGAPIKRNTSIIIVHGIGHHCIGYADSLVSDLMKELTGSNTESIRDVYQRYVGDGGRYDPPLEPSSDGQQYDQFRFPWRNGGCDFDQAFTARHAAGQPPMNSGKDLETLVLAQDQLCYAMNYSDRARKTESPTSVSCHKLYVERSPAADYRKGQGRYVVGFVRRFEKKTDSGRFVRIYEVTWSPATRWLKQSLYSVEHFNNLASAHPLNQNLKSNIVNIGIADAVAYLSDSGVLVNYDVLQAFCLTFANSRSPYTDYPFACTKKHLETAADPFDQENDVYLVSHSLGTKILFDSLGLLASPATAGRALTADRPKLVDVISERFERIGAQYPKLEKGLPKALARKIPEFARSIRGIFVFTNQLPLLAAGVTTPFRGDNDLADGFQKFLELRVKEASHDPGATDAESAKTARLQVVAFHDPDDLLSYNLSCWYYLTVLKDLEGTKDRVEEEAQSRVKSRMTELVTKKEGEELLGKERRALRNSLFVDSCSKGKRINGRDNEVARDIWAAQENKLELIDASVRLRGFRIMQLLASPVDVHSNYFSDPLVHKWLINGNRNPGERNVHEARL